VAWPRSIEPRRGVPMDVGTGSRDPDSPHETWNHHRTGPRGSVYVSRLPADGDWVEGQCRDADGPVDADERGCVRMDGSVRIVASGIQSAGDHGLEPRESCRRGVVL